MKKGWEKTTNQLNLEERRLKVGMNEKEIQFLLETTKNINTYFEYGCGGSTVFVYDNSSAKVP